MSAKRSAAGSSAILTVAVAIAFSVASCSGGGGGGGTIAPPPVGNPSPLPSGSPYPSANGDTFAYSGTNTQTITRFVPTPNPPPPVTTKATVAQNQTVATGQVFHGKAATDFQTTETDVTPNQTITTNSDNYFVIPSGSGNVVQLGFSSTDSNGVSLDVQYLAGNGIIDQLPETNGASWINNAAATITENDPDGTTSTQNINADGSYHETANSLAGTTTITENSDATGTATVPTTAFFGDGTATKFTIGLQSAGQIPVTISAVGAPDTLTVNVPAWYQVSPSLASDTTTNTGTTSTPAHCAAAAFPGIGIDLHEVRTRLDAVLGYAETETQDRWIVPSIGPTCAKITDVVTLYYDLSGQATTLSDIFVSTGVQKTSITELLGLQSATILDSARHRLDLRRSQAEFAARFELSRERIERFRQTVRLQQLHRLQRYLERKRLP